MKAKVKRFEMNKRFNINGNYNEVNCVGYFNSDFFCLLDINKRQEEIYNLSKHIYETDKINECKILYEVLEYMRVELLNISNPIIW